MRHRQLRWPVPDELEAKLVGQRVSQVRRRGKYLIVDCGPGHLIIHLGMSGALRIFDQTPTAPGIHDHIDIRFGQARLLRYTDPRRFGAFLYTELAPEEHRLLRGIGVEPLHDDFDGAYLYQATRGRRLPVKALLMDSKIVAGVGNIYANEALYRAAIRPRRRAGSLSRLACASLASAVKTVLGQAIEAGGTTLRDFVTAEGRPGYFRQSLAVYGRAGQPCPVCGACLKEIRIAQRSSVYCPDCQR